MRDKVDNLIKAGDKLMIEFWNKEGDICDSCTARVLTSKWWNKDYDIIDNNLFVIINKKRIRIDCLNHKNIFIIER